MTASSDELLLAIDCGTQSVRALLIDLGGIIVAKRQQALEGYSAVREGWLEHDAEALWQATTWMGGGWVLEVDIKRFFDTLDHEHLREILRQRVRDGVILRLIE